MLNSMRNKIITAFIVVATVPLLLLGFYIYSQMVKVLESEVRQATSKEMLQIDHSIAIMLNDIKENSQYLACNETVKMADDTVDTFFDKQGDILPAYNKDEIQGKIYAEFELYASKHPEVAYVYMGTENGGFIQWPQRPIKGGMNPRTRPWYQPTIQNPEETFLSEPYETYDGSKFIVTTSSVVKNSDGKVIGVLGIDVSLAQLTRKISELTVGDTGYVFMFTDNGTIMAHPQKELLAQDISMLVNGGAITPEGGKVSLDFPEYRQLLEGPDEYFETIINGKLCFVNVQTSAVTGWKLATVVAKDEVVGKARKLSLFIIFSTIALIIMILASIPLFSHRLTRRMDELVKHLQNIAGGSFSERLPQKLLNADDEIGRVANAIDFMQTSRQQAEWELQASNEELSATYGQLAATEAELRVQLDQLSINQQELAKSEERYRLVTEGSKDAIWDWDIKAKKITLLGQWAEKMGFAGDVFEYESLSDQRVVAKMYPDDIERRRQKLIDHLEGRTAEYICEYRIKTKKGENLWILGRGKALFDAEGKAVRMAGSITDITQEKLQKMQMQHMAYHDAMTGLANRLAFSEKMRVELGINEAQQSGALLFIDLDNFKMINDSLGHATGDKFLIEVADTLKRVTNGQFVARLGGDEFIIILSGETDRQKIGKFAQNIIKAVGQEVSSTSREALVVTLSMGIALYPEDSSDPEVLLKNADIALQWAKKQGKHRCEFFNIDMEKDIIRKMQLEAGLRKALQNGELALHYQPIVDADRHVVAFEALLRWQSPEYGFVPPAQFIPIAEESNLIVEIGEWVLRTACLFGRKIHDAGWPDVYIAVNVSVREWLQDDFTDKVAAVLNETAFLKNCLNLEIVETMLIENFEKVTYKIQKLRDQGIRIALDDFGTGYSSLTYLKELPVDTIKIDKTFIDALLTENGYSAITETVIELAHKMGLDVVAEGVETEGQMSFLQKAKCDKIQGYLISKPLPEKAIWQEYCITLK